MLDLRGGRGYWLLMVLWLGVLSSTGYAQAPEKARQIYSIVSQSFEPNRGQAAPAIDFISHGLGYTVLLSPNEADLQLMTTTVKAPSPAPTRTVRMRLLQANPHAPAKALGLQTGKSNYFVGSNPRSWQTDIPHYARVEYRDVYPGVDVAYYGNHQQLEYDFVLTPQADARKIVFAIEGADRIQIDQAGDLVVTVGSAQMRQMRPVVYQNLPSGKRRIEARYVDRGRHRIGVELSAYDNRRPLVIDPVLIFSTYFGGNGDDSGSSIKLDAARNTYFCGKTGSTNFPGIPFPGTPVLDGSGTAAYVVKLNSSGTVIFSTYISGTSDKAVCGGVAVDSNKNVYLVGLTAAADFPTKNPIQPTYHGSGDSFVLELNSSANALVYSTYLGGSALDYPHGIEVDGQANAYVTGSTASLDFPTLNAEQPTYGGGGIDAFAAKIASGGSALVYSTYIGGSGYDYDNGIAIDRSGNLYAFGDTGSINFPVKNAFQSVSGGETDGWVSKLDPTGSLIYATYIGGSGGDIVRGAKVDKAGNLHLTGSTASLNFPILNAIQSNYGGGLSDAWAASLNSSGSALIYSTYIGGTGDDEAWDIALDRLGNVYIAGLTSSTDFPTVNPIQSSNAGGYDAFVTKINATGTALVFSTYLGGGGTDFARQLAVDPLAKAYLTGTTSSTNFPTARPLQSTFGGGPEDAFITVIGTCDITLTPPEARFGPNGGKGTISVTTTQECGWKATSNRSWITITAGKSGHGPGSISYSIAPYSQGQQSYGSITVADQTFKIHRTKH